MDKEKMIDKSPPPAYFTTTAEGAAISRNARKREICKTLRAARFVSSELVLCRPEHLS